MRLIDADALMREVIELNTLRKVYALIANAPTIDAVEVVRCKDCDNYSECEYDLIKSLENGYCSFGERSE